MSLCNLYNTQDKFGDVISLTVFLRAVFLKKQKGHIDFQYKCDMVSNNTRFSNTDSFVKCMELNFYELTIFYDC